MREDENATEGCGGFLRETAGGLERGERLAESHLRIPEIAVVRPKAGDGVADGSELFVAENDGIGRGGRGGRRPGIERGIAPAGRGDGGTGGFERAAEPFGAFVPEIEIVAGNAGSDEDRVNGGVAGWRSAACCVGRRNHRLRVEEFVADAGRLRVGIDSLLRGAVEFAAVRRERGGVEASRNGCLADFEETVVRLVRDAEDVDQFRGERGRVVGRGGVHAVAPPCATEGKSSWNGTARGSKSDFVQSTTSGRTPLWRR